MVQAEKERETSQRRGSGLLAAALSAAEEERSTGTLQGTLVQWKNARKMLRGWATEHKSKRGTVRRQTIPHYHRHSLLNRKPLATFPVVTHSFGKTQFRV